MGRGAFRHHGIGTRERRPMGAQLLGAGRGQLSTRLLVAPLSGVLDCPAVSDFLSSFFRPFLYLFVCFGYFLSPLIVLSVGPTRVFFFFCAFFYFFIRLFFEAPVDFLSSFFEYFYPNLEPRIPNPKSRNPNPETLILNTGCY